MGRIAIDLLPRNAELARRAAGGDGAAFVRLYDQYAAEVLEVSLAATGDMEAAADATQKAFLQILRRPPAMAAPDSDVDERLRAMALGHLGETVSTDGGTVNGHESPAGYGVGWLRSETVAKAGARFDDDWSVHLAEAPEPAREGVASERPAFVTASAGLTPR